MMSEETYTACQGTIEGRELDYVRVVGIQRPVRIYEVIGKKKDITPEQVYISSIHPSISIIHASSLPYYFLNLVAIEREIRRSEANLLPREISGCQTDISEPAG